MKKAIVIGASSGIGRALSLVLAKDDYIVGVLARRMDKLLELEKEMGNIALVKKIDVTNQKEAIACLEALIAEMEGVDLIVVNAGILFHGQKFEWEEERLTIETNVLGFAAMAHTAMKYFLKRGRGHLVGISSIAAIRGGRHNPSYGASKAFVSNFLEGLRVKVFKAKKDICITDIQPGWVNTDMIKGEDTFWVSSPEIAANQIYSAIKKRRLHAYITKRWRLCAWLLKLTPRWLYYRLI